MLSCREVAENADRYLDRELGLRQRLQMRLHLALCRHCARHVAQLRAMVAMLRDLRPEPGDPAQRERLVRLLRERQGS